MHNPTQLFSTVSLLVLLTAAPANLWGMINEEDGVSNTVTPKPVVTEEKKDQPQVVVSKGWFSWFLPSESEDKANEGASTAVQAEKELGMTSEELANASVSELTEKLEAGNLSEEAKKFIKSLIQEKEIKEQLDLTSSQLVLASPERLEELQKDENLTEEMQALVSSAITAQKEGGNPEEQAQKVIQQASSEWGWGSTIAYYTLGAPVTLPYELIKGVGSLFVGSSPKNAENEDSKKVSSPEEALNITAVEKVSEDNPKEEDTVSVDETKAQPVASEAPKKSRAQKRAEAREAKKALKRKNNDRLEQLDYIQEFLKGPNDKKSQNAVNNRKKVKGKRRH